MEINLKVHRKRIGTLKEVGNLIGVDAVTVNKWELGKAYPRREHLRRFSEVLGIAEGELLQLIDQSKQQRIIKEGESNG